MLAFFGNLSPWELLLVLVIAILVFGRRLPQVAAQGAAHLNRFRRQLSAMWRETGLSEEWSNLQREVDQVRRFDPLRGDPPKRREPWERPRALPDPHASPDPHGADEPDGADEPAADLAARHAPEVPWSGDEHGPGPEEARSAASQPADPSAAPPAGGDGDGGRLDFGAPRGSVPRS